MGKHLSLRVLVLAFTLLAAGAAFSQPYNAWLTNVSGHGYVQLPNAANLDFSGKSFTFEAWVSVTDGGSCTSLAGNGFTASSWIGVCGTELRSYLQGSGSAYTIGTVPSGDWTHVAVTFDNVTKKHSHYIDGELAGERIDAAGISTPAAAWRIFSDVSWQFTPVGAIDEVRFWSVARTKEQIRSTINQEIDAPQAGLVSVYELDADATDAVGGNHGTKNGTANYLNAAVILGCSTSTNTLCVGPSGRYALSATYKTVSTSGNGTVVPFQTSDSGLFTFFGDSNWEMVVKVLNGCPVNSRWWVFASGLTDQHVELVVSDLPHGVTRRYFNYSGQPFNTITDTDAFATCP
jgi:hypothetical protein